MTRPLFRAALLGALLPACAAPAAADAASDGLPVVEVPASEQAPASDVVVILMSGDGGWASIDKRLAARLSAAGVLVVGLDMRAYLLRKPTPDRAGREVGELARHYMATWHRARVAIVGYSRGADLAPFIANRLPGDVRAQLSLVAMLGPGERASFHFHWIDLVRKSSDPGDLPLAPELEHLRGTPMLCVYGRDEGESGCRDADSTLVHRHATNGGHHFDGNFEAVADLVLAALKP
ncbi:MAG TPA: AcvB/VirJ family lysyl-phosphatidylglycerol hydrolase [Gemmatimonadaceae bacterium]|nr:AcvB/VirJ family lysyl-phosphatidylglycerol hydrolase [Gemmatimonadaceae bacterium]